MSDFDDRIKIIEADVKRIASNDLPHINTKITALITNQKWLTVLSVVILGAIVAGVVQTYFK